jgi:hypothetical protein
MVTCLERGNVPFLGSAPSQPPLARRPQPMHFVLAVPCFHFLGNATKGALVVTELTKAYDARRGRGKQTVNVGQVNVEAGGQAVVGNVTASRPDEVAHPASASQTEMDVVGNTPSEKRPEEATQEMSLSEPKIEDPAPPKK